MSWQKVKLGELYEVHNGLSKPKDAFGNGYPFLSYSVVFNNYFLPDILTSLVQTDEKEQESYSIKEGDVFITRTSETSDELGMSSVALRDYPHATYNGFCKRLRPTTDRVVPRYIGYYLRAPEFRCRFDGLGASMITRASLKNEDLLAMDVALPDKPIQRKIAEILGAYDDLIENNRKRIALLEKMARELYRERFVRRRDGLFETKSASDWFGEITIGKTPPRKEADHFVGEIPWVSISDMGREGMFVFETSEHLAEASVRDLHIKIIPARTLLLSFKLTVGRLAITTEDCCTNEAIAHLRVSEHLIPYMYLYLKDYNYARLGNTCAISDGINSKIVKSMPIEVPDDKGIDSFNEIAAPIFDEMLVLARQSRNLAKQRDRLLPRLMSGKIDVEKLVKEGV